MCYRPNGDGDIEKLLKTFYFNLSKMHASFQEYAKVKIKARKDGKMDSFKTYLRWMERINCFEDLKKFTGKEKNQFKDSDMMNHYEFFINQSLYDRMNLIWSFRFGEKFIRRLQSLAQDYVHKILTAVFALAQGNFDHAKVFKFGPVTFMACFHERINWRDVLAFCILPERVPIIADGKVTSYHYYQYIRFIDVVTSESRLSNCFDAFFKTIADHPDKFSSFQNGEYFYMFSFLEPEFFSNFRRKDINNVVYGFKKGNKTVLNYEPKLSSRYIAIPKSASASLSYSKDKMCWEHIEAIKATNGSEGGSEQIEETNYMQRAIYVLFRVTGRGRRTERRSRGSLVKRAASGSCPSSKPFLILM
eukprot:TRINITY_DN753_c0_g2_i1.p1 TRINITY_DN753_c0_g2~~TRINITY_DN753_c0_g2_i1.p1  ORF type:complete len:361 (-),score=53.37 TRINITY_DN753_c0_g2_i1:239-1321(-)